MLPRVQQKFNSNQQRTALVTESRYSETSWSQVTWLVVTAVRSASFGLVTERCHYNERPIYTSLSYVANVIFFIVECGIARFLCAMRVFKVQASSSSPRLPLCQIVVSFAASTAELAHWEKSGTQSINQSPSLLDAPRTEAFAPEQTI